MLYRQIFHKKKSIIHLTYPVNLKITILTMDLENLYKKPTSGIERPVKYKFLFVAETSVPSLYSCEVKQPSYKREAYLDK